MKTTTPPSSSFSTSTSSSLSSCFPNKPSSSDADVAAVDSLWQGFESCSSSATKPKTTSRALLFRRDMRNKNTLSSTSSSSMNATDVLDVLDEVEHVLDQEENCNFSLEPLPIDPGRAQIVPQVLISQKLWQRHSPADDSVSCDDFLNILKPLLLLPSTTTTALNNNNNNKRKLVDPELVSSSSSSSFLMDAAGRPSSAKKQRRTQWTSLEEEEEQEDDSEDGNAATTSTTTTTGNRFRSYQSEQWSERYEDLVDFRERIGHCLVPHVLPENPALAQWVKRQRYQYKLLLSGKHSTLTQERVSALEQLGFVWDSHTAAWNERWNELKQFQSVHGHCNVPSTSSNRTLAVWVKCQRRNFKLFSHGQKSNMTLERMELLESLNFVWNPRRGPGCCGGGNESD